MANENETIADIIAEMRRREKSHYYPKVARNIMHQYSDRIDAARNREREKIAAETRQRSAADSGCPNVLKNTDVIIAQSAPVGNAAALREALEELNELFDSCVLGTHSEMTADEMDKVDELYFKTKAALSKPPRNCDVEYADRVEMYGAFKDWCKANGHTMEPMLAYDAFDWLLAPAAERKGESDDA